LRPIGGADLGQKLALGGFRDLQNFKLALIDVKFYALANQGA
jgi:hypothetical protein